MNKVGRWKTYEDTTKKVMMQHCNRLTTGVLTYKRVSLCTLYSPIQIRHVSYIMPQIPWSELVRICSFLLGSSESHGI